jgi:hypothetical protein
MPYKIVQHGNKFSVVAQNTGHVAGTHSSKKKAQAQMAALYANEPEANVKKESVGAGRIGGGVGFKLEYNVADCQGGWAVTKQGTGQVIGCYTTKEHAQEAMKAIAVNEPDITKKIDIADPNTVAGTLQQGPQQDGDDEMNFWTGAFSPFKHVRDEREPMVPTYNSPPQHDGEPSVGYGNSSSPKGKSNS